MNKVALKRLRDTIQSQVNELVARDKSLHQAYIAANLTTPYGRSITKACDQNYARLDELYGQLDELCDRIAWLERDATEEESSEQLRLIARGYNLSEM